MFAPDQYELIDFGAGRKLERFGSVLLDRPSPAADGIEKGSPQVWAEANARFTRKANESGRWSGRSKVPSSWVVRHGELAFEIKRTDFGHVGLFPEQAANWDWIGRQVKRARRPLKVLNLFGYTGGSTLAAAAAGAEVVHVDAARNVVDWARRNAQHSELAAAPIRWIHEDATLFVRRELKRGNRYDAVILDPPSYGHGPKGQAWKISADLPSLLEDCAELTKADRAFVLFSCHTAGYGPAELEAMLADTFFGHCGAGANGREMCLRTAGGRALSAGVVARWP